MKTEGPLTMHCAVRKRTMPCPEIASARVLFRRVCNLLYRHRLLGAAGLYARFGRLRERAALSRRAPPSDILQYEARATTELIASFCDEGELARAVDFYRRFEALRSLAPTEPEIVRAEAAATVVLIEEHMNYGDDPEAAAQFYARFASLENLLPGDPEVLIKEAEGITAMIVGWCDGEEPEKAAGLYSRFEELEAILPGRPEIEAQKAKASVALGGDALKYSDQMQLIRRMRPDIL